MRKSQYLSLPERYRFSKKIYFEIYSLNSKNIGHFRGKIEFIFLVENKFSSFH